MELEIVRPLDSEKFAPLLYGTKYITVHYRPIPPYEGPDLWVFLNAKTTDVITSYKDER